MRVNEVVFSVLTATYNRRHTLERLYASLAASDYTSFEWVVVDDGSTDGSEELIASLAARAPFPIVYEKQENCGKYIAFNRGVQAARGVFIVNVDSDDELLANSLSNMDRLWNQIPKGDRSHFVGVTGLCVTPERQVIGDAFRCSPMDSDSAALGIAGRIKGDKAGFQRRDILLAHPFPENVPTKFIPEGRIWLEIALRYKTRFVNEPFVVVHDGGHQRLSRLSRISRGPGDYEYSSFALTAFAKRFALSAPMSVLKVALLAVRSGRSVGRSFVQSIADAKGLAAKAFLLAAYPAGVALYVADLAKAFGELGILVATSRALPRNLFGRKAANLIRRFYLRKRRGEVEINVFDSMMALEPHQCVDGWALFYPHIFDFREIAFLMKETPKTGVFVDVGANIGFYSLRMASHISGGQILAIEADPYNVAKLRRNIDLSNARNIEVFAGGVADRAGVLRMRLNTTGNRGGNSFAISTPGDSIEVPCLPLLQVLQDAGLARVDGIKLDIEGFEYPVLKVFFDTAAEAMWPRAVVIEVEPELVKQDEGDVLSLLRGKGYRIARQVEANYMMIRRPS